MSDLDTTLFPAWCHRPSDTDQWTGLLGKILQAFSCKTGTIHRVDRVTGLLTLVAQIGIPLELLDKVTHIPVGKGIAGAAAQKLEPVQFCNIQTDDTGMVRPEARKTNVQGALAVPVMRGERLVGVLGVGKMEPHDFTGEEIREVLAMGQRIAEWLDS